MNIQSLIAEFPAFTPKPVQKVATDDEIDASKDPFVGLAPGSANIKISLPLLEALAHLSSVGARDNNSDELKSANESARRILHEYMRQEFGEKKAIPKAFIDLFTPGAQTELNWEGVVLKIHQSYLESPELQSLMQKILRSPEHSSEQGPLKMSMDRLPFQKGRFSMKEEAPTPELPSRQNHPKLLKLLPFVPVKPDADKRTIISNVPNAKPEGVLSPMEDRDEDTQEEDETVQRRTRFGASSSYKESIEERDDIPKLSSSFKETLTFPPSGMATSTTPPVPAKTITGFSLTTSKHAQSHSEDSSPSTRKKRSSFVAGSGVGGQQQPFMVDDPTILSNKYTDRRENLPEERPMATAQASRVVGPNILFNNSPAVDTLGKSGGGEELSPLHLEKLESQVVEQEAEVKNMVILDPATAYRREFYKERNEVKNSEFVKRGNNGILVDVVPTWFDVLVYWGESPLPNGQINIPIEFVCLANSARGHYDFALQIAIIYQLKSILKSPGAVSPHLNFIIDTWINARSFVIENKCVEYLRSEFESFRKVRWTEDIYQEYVEDIIASRGNDFDFNSIIVTLESELLLLRRVKHLPSLDLIGRLLVSLLGDDRVPARESAVRLLNILHDGHDFQSLQALTPVIRTIGDSFVVEVDIGDSTIEEGGAYLLVYGPSLSGGSKSVLSRYTPSLRGTRLRVSQLPSFKKAGYYDWIRHC